MVDTSGPNKNLIFDGVKTEQVVFGDSLGEGKQPRQHPRCSQSRLGFINTNQMGMEGRPDLALKAVIDGCIVFDCRCFRKR